MRSSAPTVEEQVAKVLDEAIELADLGGRSMPAPKIAERIFDTESDLMRETHRLWAIDRLTWMVTRRRRERWRDKSPDQMLLPDPVFQDLPKSIFLRDGRRPKLNFCTLTDTEDHLKLLRERFKNHSRITQMEAVVQLHRKWAAQWRGIPWGEAKRREAEELARV